MTTPRLSVITACYQHGQYLRESAESVLRSTEPNIELLIIDDGSTDDSRAVALSLAAQDPRVHVHRNINNCGLAFSQNRGIAAALGEWVLKVDADDRVSATYVEEILRVADRKPSVNVVFSPAHLFGAHEMIYRYPAFDPARMIDQLMIPGPAAFRKSLWAAVGGYDETMRSAEDWDLYIRAQLVVGLVPHQLPYALWHYRQHSGVRASAHGMARIKHLQRYWRGHTKESVLARSRTWAQWCQEQQVAA